MDDLTRWLGERLDDDERIARAACKYASPEWHLDEEFRETVLWWPPEFHTPYEEDKHWRGQALDGQLAPHIAEHDPARALREIDAKRQALAHYERIRQHTRQGDEAYVLAEGAVSKQIQIMATAYADRPGYREEWRP